MLSMSTHNSHKLLKKTLTVRPLEEGKEGCLPSEAISHVHVVLVCHVTIPYPHSTLPPWVSMKAVECTSVLTSVTTSCKNYSRNVWRFWLEELAEKWPIILKNCSMLGDTYNAQKNASIIYLGPAHTSLNSLLIFPWRCACTKDKAIARHPGSDLDRL